MRHLKFLLILQLILAILSLSAPAFAAEANQTQVPKGRPIVTYSDDSDNLPYMEGWINQPVRTTVLNTISGDKGTWVERDYRTAQGVAAHAVWVDGAGTTSWEVPKGEISANDGPLGNNNSYKTAEISGVRVLIEHSDVTGYSIAGKIGGGVLTVESLLANERELVSVFEELLNKIKAK